MNIIYLLFHGLSPYSFFAYNIYNLLAFLAKDGSIKLDMNDEIVQSILVTIDGEIVHKGAREAMGL